jgi:hypothetical protein
VPTKQEPIPGVSGSERAGGQRLRISLVGEQGEYGVDIAVAGAGPIPVALDAEHPMGDLVVLKAA